MRALALKELSLTGLLSEMNPNKFLEVSSKYNFLEYVSYMKFLNETNLISLTNNFKFLVCSLIKKVTLAQGFSFKATLYFVEHPFTEYLRMTANI